MGKDHSIFPNFLGSFVLVTLIPITIMFAILYSSNVNNAKRELIDSSVSDLSKAKEILELQIKGCDDIAKSMIFNSKLSAGNMLSGGYKAIEGIGEINKYRLANDRIDDIGVVYPNGSLFYSSKGTMRLEILGAFVYGFRGESLEQFCASVRTCSEPGFLFYNDCDYFIYLVPIKMMGGRLGSASCTAAFIFRKELIYSLFQNATFGQDAVFLLAGREGKPLLAFPQELSEAECAELIGAVSEAPRKSEAFSVESKKKISVSAADSANLGLTLITAFPLDTINYHALADMSFNIATTLAVLVACTAIAAIIAYKRYIPIRRLSNTALGSLAPKNAGRPRTNELDNLRIAICQNVALNENLASQRSINRDMLRRDFLRRALRGEIPSEEELLRLAAACEVSLQGPCYLVLVAAQAKGSPRSSGPPRSPVLDIQCVEFAHSHVFLLNLQYPATHEALRDIIEFVRSWYPPQERADMLIGVGEVCSSTLAIKTSYYQASAALDIRLRHDEHRVYYYDHQALNCHLQFLTVQENTILNGIFSGDWNQTSHILEQLYKKIYFWHEDSPCSSRIRGQLIAIFTKSLGELDRRALLSDAQRRELSMCLFQLPFTEGFEEFRQSVSALGSTVCGLISQGRRPGSQPAAGVLSYVEENFRDTQISLERIASCYGHSYYYWSRYFTEKVGVPFSDYIWKLRVAEAKRLLVETGKTVSSIVKEIGYSDQTSFSRRFKNETLVTPGRYRALYREGGASSLSEGALSKTTV
jgi:AraC-like DNA-binding protein